MTWQEPEDDVTMEVKISSNHPTLFSFPQDSQMLLNMYCNNDMNHNDGTCCNSTEQTTTLQLITGIGFLVWYDTICLLFIVHNSDFESLGVFQVVLKGEVMKEGNCMSHNISIIYKVLRSLFTLNAKDFYGKESILIFSYCLIPQKGFNLEIESYSQYFMSFPGNSGMGQNFGHVVENTYIDRNQKKNNYNSSPSPL